VRKKNVERERSKRTVDREDGGEGREMKEARKSEGKKMNKINRDPCHVVSF